MPLHLHARRRIWLAALAAAMLVLVQALGLAHRVAHGGHAADHELHGLFDGHEDKSAACQLYDQLTHGDLAGWPLAALVLPPWVEAVAPAWQSAVLAARAGAFRARGPPAAA